ncbi:hypothetical protein PIIN_01872 [Serendipita indica DSM 11827]|uniref:Uncharacterized protein n=1 Tax=Serendipita indica (strain DSM 11827) TaxID=1109443 RepID=G4T9L2_SERID|nr:hypothetical protein PIIN_01872 [Serendipita indica DSM 11827]
MSTPTGGAGAASTRMARGAGGRAAVNGAPTGRGGAASASAAGGAIHESLRGTPHDVLRGPAHDSLRGAPHDSLRVGGGAPHESLRRPNPYLDTDEPTPKKRRVRHCAKCGGQTCKGRGGGSNCPNPCRDCHRMECKGRSSTKPGRMCDTMLGGGGG